MTDNGHERAKPLRTGDPHQLGDYRIEGRLGRGGMGTVYLARDTAERLVAVKLIHPDLTDAPDFRRRFAREVESARKVARFSTAGVLDARLDGDPLFIVSEYVPGPNLAQAVSADGPMNGGTLESLALGVAAALTAIHRAGVIHRDLKPGNVLLSAVGPKVIDFGIARAMDDESAVTRSSQLMGTPSYLAPELIAGGRITPASDIFSWGCLVAYAGIGKAPFDAQTVPAVLHLISSGEADLEGLDPRLCDLVRSALDKDPGNRPTAQHLLSMLVGQDDPAEAIVDSTVVECWTPPSVVGAAGTAGAGAAAGSAEAPTEPSTRAFAPESPARPPSTQPYTGTAPPPPGRPASGPQTSYGQGAPGHAPPGGHPPPGPPEQPYGHPSGPQPPYGPGSGPQQPDAPTRGKGRTGLLIGAIAGVLLLVAGGAVGSVLLLGGGPPEGTLIYQDDFASSAWESDDYDPEDEFLEYAYHAEHGLILRVSEYNDDNGSVGSFAPYTGTYPEAVLVEAEAEALAGPAYSEHGVRCFHRSTEDDEVVTHYEGLVRFDGGSAQIRRVGGDSGEAAMATTDDVDGFAQPPNKLPMRNGTDGGGGETVTNTLAMACEYDADAGTLAVDLWVNGAHVLEATDDQPLAGGKPGGTGVTVKRRGSETDTPMAGFHRFEVERLNSAGSGGDA
ncbi:serine/threonine-protein kinase [Streptomonospora wellingtoniae]|uniref:Serine/threonine-protein kinase n=1 Tax=Streptomonospora wellingtoniae TaxID=3075544 RepID=A0ABU2KPY8_9ACTN|nr:serine/threonine-protein kinase [Streptomonospora sp. DSM 45055]MDT0301271.1 serine/threonine-protein kinase [Streptomonospora sp. DSM 45055]